MRAQKLLLTGKVEFLLLLKINPKFFRKVA